MVNMKSFRTIRLRALFCFFLLLFQVNGMYAQSDEGQGSHPQGLGTQESPLLIENAFDLEWLRYKLENERDWSVGKYFALNADIRLNDKVLDANGELSSDGESLDTWKPIGHGETLSQSHAFKGVFDGKGHTISGLYINNTEEQAGLFGFLGKEAEVKNLKFEDCYVKGNGPIGILAAESNEATISNCEVYSGLVIGTGASFQAGGIIGHPNGGGVYDCINRANVYGNSVPNEYGERYNCDTGGIAGSTGCYLSGCINEGNIHIYEWSSIGGVAGSVNGSGTINQCINRGTVSASIKAEIGGIVGNNWTRVYNCINEGQVIAMATQSFVGGIVGVCSFNSITSGSTNYANLYSALDNVYVGGIIGNGKGENTGYGYYTPKVRTSKNYGTITVEGQESHSGGILGKSYCTDIIECENFAKIDANGYAAGISPFMEYHTSAQSCKNMGDVTGIGEVAGIGCYVTDGVYGCFNSGTIRSKARGAKVGGIIAYTSNGSVSDCVNVGKVQNGFFVGGIAAHSSGYGGVSNSYNAGEVSTDEEAYIGGLMGYCSGSIRNSYNLGDVIAYDGNANNIGGLMGSAYAPSITNSYNVGQVEGRGGNGKIGSMVGCYPQGVSNIRNSYCLNGVLNATEDYEVMDRNFSSVKQFDNEELTTLADRLNSTTSVEWGDKIPYSQGYYRPVLNKNYESVENLYYEVITLKGDNVLIDLGKPSDNAFFTTLDTAAYKAYNVIDSVNRIAKAYITDLKDIVIDRDVVAKELEYNRPLPQGYSTLFLPFGINLEDYDVDIYETVLVQDGQTVLGKTNENHFVAACTPVVLYTEEETNSLRIKDSNVTIMKASQPDEQVLFGVLEETSPISNDIFALNNTESKIIRCGDTDTLSPQRAYFRINNESLSELPLVISISTAIDYNMRAVNGKPEYYDLSGRRLAAPASSGTTIIKYANGKTKTYIKQ